MNTLRFFIRTTQKHLHFHRTRSLLTIGSISIGIAAFIAVQAIGHGARAVLKQQLESFGTNYIFISNMRNAQTKKGQHSAMLTIHDAQAISRQIPGVAACSGLVSVPVQVQALGKSLVTELKGGQEQLLDIIGRKLKLGSRFCTNYARHNEPVCLLGSQAATTLFGTRNPLGTMITIDQNPFMVIGVLAQLDTKPQQADSDIFAPLSTVQRTFLGLKKNKNKIHSLVLSTRYKDQIPHVIQEIRTLLRKRHRLPQYVPDFFSVWDQYSVYEQAKASRSLLRMLLLCIIGIVMLVGGIGLSNMMLLDVIGRRHEIGVRMALGATSRTILLQFIIEAVSLCLLGGIVGYLMGTLFCYGAHIVLEIPLVMQLRLLPLVLCITMVLGVLCGAYPAHKATLVQPVEALRTA